MLNKMENINVFTIPSLIYLREVSNSVYIGFIVKSCAFNYKMDI